MTADMKRLAEALFDQACYEARARGYVGEDVILVARDEIHRITSKVYAAQRSALRRESTA